MRSHEESLNEVVGRDDLFQTILRVLKPPGEAVFFIGGTYAIEAIRGLNPGGIMLICDGDAIRVAEALGDYFSTRPVKIVWQNEVRHVYPQGKRQRGITVMPMSGSDINEHLAGSGFTIHSMAFDMGKGLPYELIDPLGGVSDLDGGMLKRSAMGAVLDNPDRILTAVGLAARYGLRIDSDTADELKAASLSLDSVPSRRTWWRMLRLFEGGNLSLKAGLLRKTGVFDTVFPELKAIFNVPQNYYHHLGVWDHTMETLDNIEEILGALLEMFPANAAGIMKHLNEEVEEGITRKGFLAFMGLVHDIGKAESMKVLPSGRIRFKGHEETGARLTAEMADRLGAGPTVKRYMVEFSRMHMELGFLMEEGENARSRMKAIDNMGDLCVEISIHSLADRRATRGEAASPEALAGFERMTKRVIRDYFWLKDRNRLIDGNDVMVHCGIAEGPAVREMLTKVLVAQREGLIENRHQALEYIAPDFKGKMKC